MIQVHMKPVKYTYMIGDDDEEDYVQESKDTNEGIVQHQVIFPSIHNKL